MRSGLQITSYIKSLKRLSNPAIETDSLIVLGKLKGLRNREKEGRGRGRKFNRKLPDFRV